MAQVGCYVPATSAQFRLVDTIFSRIGTSDSIECNASTFMLVRPFLISNVTFNFLLMMDVITGVELFFSFYVPNPRLFISGLMSPDGAARIFS